MNRIIKDATVKRYHYQLPGQIKAYLHIFVMTYSLGKVVQKTGTLLIYWISLRTFHSTISETESRNLRFDPAFIR